MSMLIKTQIIALILVCALPTPTNALNKSRKQQLPRFKDYPVTKVWRGKAAPLKVNDSVERMFQSTLRRAAIDPPNFAGHYRLARWGCGAECMVGALIDLRTGQINAAPLANKSNDASRFNICQSAYYPSEIKHRVDSRLIIVRCGLNFILRLNKNVPDTYYLVWENKRFRLLRHLHTRPDS
jgi:hypothetical protein